MPKPESMDSLKRYSDKVFKEYIGYTPTSDSIRPIYIANGLFRYCLEEYFITNNLHEWVMGGRSKESERLNAEYINNKYKSIIKNADYLDLKEIDIFRSFLEKLFNQDGAAYGAFNFSVLNISSRVQIKDHVDSESSINKFLYKVLAAKLNGKQSKIIEIINSCLKDEDDELSMLIKPITIFNNMNDVNIKKCELPENYLNEINEYQLTGVELHIRKAFDKLAENILKLKEDKLLTLQRVVSFSCFSIIYHLISKVTDVNNKHYSLEDRIPILLDSGINLPAIKFTSEECFLFGKQKVEEYFAYCLSDIFKSYGMESYSHNQVLEEIERINIKGKVGYAEEIRKSFKNIYESFYSKQKNIMEAFAQAMQFVLFTQVYTTDPAKFCRVLGVRAGIVGPYKSWGARKRYLPTPFVLENILLSLLDFGEEITLADFEDKLWRQFGIIIGANSDESYNRLARYNLTSNVPGNLIGEFTVNSSAIADTYISMGYGKKYADGVTTIFIKG